MSAPIHYDTDGAIATITLARPDALNAITVEMIAALSEALDRAAADPAIRVLILTGAGRGFCVGADIGQLGQWDRDPALRARFYDAAPIFFRKLDAFPRPVIAAVNGVAAAGGFEICCYADLIVAAEDARIGDVHANFVGFGPVSVAVAPTVLPPKVALELLFTGETMSAARLHALGFVNRIAPPGQALAVARTLAAQIATKQPLALAAAKRIARRAGQADPRALLDEAYAAADRNFDTEDFREGVAAFKAKRSPEFRGR